MDTLQEGRVEPSSPIPNPPTVSGREGVSRIGYGFGQIVYRLRWIVILLWVLVLGFSSQFAAKTASVLNAGGFTFSGSESSHVSDIVVDQLGAPRSQLTYVLQSATIPATDPAFQQQIKSVADAIMAQGEAVRVTPGGIGADGKSAVLTADFNLDVNTVQSHLATYRAIVTDSNRNGPAKVYLTGTIPTYDEITYYSQHDSQAAEELATPVALVILLIVFGTLVAALTPLVLAAVAVPTALAIIYAIATHQTMNVTVLSIASVIGIGLSIDYSLFLVRRFREELAYGADAQTAVARTVATAGEAILFSGLTVLIGFMGMLLIGVQFMTSIGLAGASVVLVAATAALTLLPALLGVMGKRINALRLPFISRIIDRQLTAEHSQEGYWHRLAVGVMRRPVTVIVLVAALLLAIGWPTLQLKLGTPDASSLPPSAESRVGGDILKAQFPAANANPFFIVVQSADGSSLLTNTSLQSIAAYSEWLAVQSHVTGVTSLMRLPETPGTVTPSSQQLLTLYTSGGYQKVPAIASLVKATTNGATSLITVQTDTRLDSDAGKALVDHLRANKNQAPGLIVSVGGLQALVQDFNRYLYGNFPRAILFILLATYILLLVMFRSVLLPLKAVLMNVLSISAAYGVLVGIFQFGWLSSVTGWSTEGYIESTIPIIMFCILFGLSMDYEVFLLSRIREEWERTKDNRQAVATGLEKTGGVITNAALLLIVVAGAFTFTNLITTREIGLGITVAVLVDAAVIRTLLVPATMRLLGRWNWWLPGRPLPPRQGQMRAS